MANHNIILGALVIFCTCGATGSENKVEKIYDFVGIQQNGLRWHNYYRQVFELKPLQLHAGVRVSQISISLIYKMTNSNRHFV